MQSKAGRLVLIKSVVNSLPLYYISLFRIPSAVCRKIVQLQRKYFWGGKDEKRCIPLIKWDIIQKPRKYGGLGIGDLQNPRCSVPFQVVVEILI